MPKVVEGTAIDIEVLPVPIIVEVTETTVEAEGVRQVHRRMIYVIIAEKWGIGPMSVVILLNQSNI